MKDKKSPTCPGCGAKFSHSQPLAACKACGLPDEVATLGPREIARWKRKPTGVVAVGSVLVPGRPLDDASKRERKRRLHRHPARRPRNKHGRVGVKA